MYLRKENILADSLQRLRTLGLYRDNDPEKPGYEYGKAIFESDLEKTCNKDSSQDNNQDFEIDAVKYQLDKKDLDDLSSQDTSTHFEDHIPFKCNLDLTKVKQLQQQDMHISKLITEFKSKNHDKTLCYLDEDSIAYGKIKDGSNIFHIVVIPETLLPNILYESHNALGHTGPTRLYIFIKRYYYWKKSCQLCNKYIRLCPDCLQVTLKEP